MILAVKHFLSASPPAAVQSLHFRCIYPVQQQYGFNICVLQIVYNIDDLYMCCLISAIDPLGAAALCSQGGRALKTRGSVWFPCRSYIKGAWVPPPQRCLSPTSALCFPAINTLQQLLKLKGKNRFAESSANGFLQTPGRLQGTYRKWGVKVFDGLIDGLSQHGSQPAETHQQPEYRTSPSSKNHSVDVHQPHFRLQLVVVGFTVGVWKDSRSHFSFHPLPANHLASTFWCSK